LQGLNVAFGGEQRSEKYTITAGEEASYKNYDVAAGVAAGAQVFSGFFPQNAGSHSRNSVAGYLDLEQDITKAWVRQRGTSFRKLLRLWKYIELQIRNPLQNHRRHCITGVGEQWISRTFAATALLCQNEHIIS
jgi:hypothetical protein